MAAAEEEGEGEVDPLDAVLFLEEGFRSEGLRAAQALAVPQSRQDGRLLGEHKGLEVGKELGYYLACVRSWRAADGASMKKSVLADMAKLEALVAAFAELVASDPQVSELHRKIAGLFRKICTNLRKQAPYSQDGATGF